MLLPAILLALSLASLAWFVRNDLADYRAFKLLTASADRQKRYRSWILKGFLLFSCVTLLALAILSRLPALVVLPAEFRPLSFDLQGHSAGSFAFGALLGILIAVLGSLVLGILLAPLLGRRVKPVQLGDVESLLPRNGAETAWTALLSLNAGLGEELYFRLLLPLLLVSIGARPLAAFLLAALVFGAAHFYQGIVGVLATTLLGAAFTALYLWTGSLWVAVAAHAFIDLLSLVVRPTLVRLAEKRTASIQA